MTLPNEGTLLQLISLGIPLYSARGLTQAFSIIDQASDLRRTINGELDDLSLEQFRKYATKITCTDQESPMIDGVFPGQQVTVVCCAEFAYPIGGTPARAVQTGSERTEGAFIFYRPIMDMRITLVTTQLDEWKADYQWEIDLEEI